MHMTSYNNVAFIPARGGSESIKMKNIRPLNGRPLIYWALDAATGCGKIDMVFVATDNEEIRLAVERYNNPRVMAIKRSRESATHTAATETAMLEFAHEFDFKNIILVQATSPLITSEDLCRGIDMLENGERAYDSVLSVVNQKRFIWERNDAGFAYPVNYNPGQRPRRQDFDGYYVENGSFYITGRDNLLQSKCRVSGNIGVVVMHEKSYFEIDEPHDFVIAEQLMKQDKRERFDFSNIKAFFTDCDGVLTDGGMYYCQSGDEFKRFNAKDGMGFRLLREKGIITGIITGESSKIVQNRGAKLQLDELHMGASNKLDVLREISKRRGLDYSQIAYLGDDVNDISVLSAVGFSAAVADAADEVKQAAMYVTQRNGGMGAVREVIDMMLE